MLRNSNAKNNNSRFWVKDMRRTTVILASRAAPPLAAGSKNVFETPWKCSSHLLVAEFDYSGVWVVDYVYWKLCGLFMDLTLFSVLLAI